MKLPSIARAPSMGLTTAASAPKTNMAKKVLAAALCAGPARSSVVAWVITFFIRSFVSGVKSVAWACCLMAAAASANVVKFGNTVTMPLSTGLSTDKSHSFL